MPVAWFICTYKRDPNPGPPTRYCAMLDFDDQIQADGGHWAETEVLGNYALVKTRASTATLVAIAADPGFLRIPLSRLNDSLSSLSAQQRNAIRTRLNAMGYSDSDILTALGNNLAQRTLGDILRFAASRRLKPRYDAVQDLIVLDGAIQVCRPVADVDVDVTE